MAHFRDRYVSKKINELLSFSPIVGVFGHRQVGKTTLLSKHASDYRTLDLSENLDLATNDPMRFLAQATSGHFAIDEAQLCPNLFPALKEFVRQKKSRPGLFLLSGSVRFSSRKQIRESLTGRISTLELLPFSQSELSQLPLPRLPVDLLSKTLASIPALSKAATSNAFDKKLQNYLALGGLPGVCFLRKEEHRQARLRSQLETIIERDLQLIYQTTLPSRTVLQFLQALAADQNKPLDLRGLARRSGISVPTTKQLIRAFESLFVIRLIPTRGERTPVLFFEDQAEASYLASQGYDGMTDFIRLGFANLRQAYHYRPELQAEVFQYRTRSGAYVPIAFQTKAGTIGYIFSLDESPSPQALASAKSFLDRFPQSRVVILHQFKRVQVLNPNIALCPLSLLLQH
jgi:predicted AAA+ superfamily ATPase